MSDQTAPGTPSQPAYDRVEDILTPLLDHWLAELDLADVYYDPLKHQSRLSLAEHVAQKLGMNLDDTRTLRLTIERKYAAYLRDQHIVLTQDEQAQLFERLYAELFGMGLLETWMQASDVSEIMVNGPYQIFVERRGKLECVRPVFKNTDHLMRTIYHVLLPLGEMVDGQSPTVDARLPDDSRVNVVIPPLALNGPCLTIRKFRKNQLSMADLIRFGSLTPEMAEFLNACIKSRLNIIVAGGTGSGKTTVMNIMAQFIPDDERIITVEEVAEFQIQRDHVISLQSRLPDSDGRGGVTVRELLRTTSRMRPERIIIGELTGVEVFEALQIIRRGYDGSMMTLHANTPSEAFEQLEMMIKFNQPDLPVSYLRSFIGSSIDLVVQINRLRDGSRRITHISEVIPERENGYDLRDIFVFKISGVDERGKIIGEFSQEHPISSRLRERFEYASIYLPPSVVAQTFTLSDGRVEMLGKLGSIPTQRSFPQQPRLTVTTLLYRAVHWLWRNIRRRQ